MERNGTCLTDQDKKHISEKMGTSFDQVKMEWDCTNDVCVIRKLEDAPLSPKTKEIVEYRFKPAPPRHPKGWMSNHDLRKLMQQFQRVYPSFRCLSILDTITFKTRDVFRNPNVQSWTTYTGFIFLDKQHWVALLVDKAKKRIIFFDSEKSPPCTIIKQFIDRLRKTLPEYRIVTNSIRHQYGNVHCGSYVSWFMMEYIKKRSTDIINTRRIPDHEMETYRRQVFLYDNESLISKKPSTKTKKTSKTLKKTSKTLKKTSKKTSKKTLEKTSKKTSKAKTAKTART